MVVDLLDQKLSGVAETWWDAGGILHARTPTHSPLDVKTRINYTQTTMNFKTHPRTRAQGGGGSATRHPQNQEEHYPLAIHTAEFVRVSVLPVAGLSLCYGESNNLTWLDKNRMAYWPRSLTYVYVYGCQSHTQYHNAVAL